MVIQGRAAPANEAVLRGAADFATAGEVGGMTTYYAYLLDSLEYLGSVEAADPDAAGQLAGAVWGSPLKILSWRLHLSSRAAA